MKSFLTCGGCGKRFEMTAYIADGGFICVMAACSPECEPRARERIPETLERYRRWIMMESGAN